MFHIRILIADFQNWLLWRQGISDSFCPTFSRTIKMSHLIINLAELYNINLIGGKDNMNTYQWMSKYTLTNSHFWFLSKTNSVVFNVLTYVLRWISSKSRFLYIFYQKPNSVSNVLTYILRWTWSSKIVYGNRRELARQARVDCT